MNQEYLLTYTQDLIARYEWFDSEEEMNEWLDENGKYITVNEKLHVVNALLLD